MRLGGSAAAEIEILHAVARAQRRRVFLVRGNAVLQHHRAMRISQRDRGVLLSDQDRQTFLDVEAFQRTKYVLYNEWRQTHRRLVEREQTWGRHQRATNGQHLLL